MAKRRMQHIKTGKVKNFWAIDAKDLDEDEWRPAPASQDAEVRQAKPGPDGQGPPPVYLKDKPWLAKRKEIQELLGKEKAPASAVEAEEWLTDAGYEVVK